MNRTRPRGAAAVGRPPARAAIRLWVALAWVLALGLAVATVLLEPAMVVDLTHFDGGLSLLLVGLPFVAMGAVLGLRRPGNPIGWLFQAWGLVMALASFVYAYTLSGTRAGANWLGWAMEVVWHPAFALLVFILLLFPHGRLPTPRWKGFAYAVPVVYVALAVAIAVSPGAWALYNAELPPPFPLLGGVVADGAFWVLLYGQLLLVAIAMVGLLLRLRRARGQERQQIKAFVFAVGLAVAVFIAGILVWGAGYLFPVFALIPVMAGLAIMRYRLYEIDRIVSRTTAYAATVALLGLVYAGLVVGLRGLLPVSGDLPVALSTLVVAFAFLPLLRQVQRWVDQRFFRSRYDAGAVVARLADDLRGSLDLSEVTERAGAVMDEVFRPEAVGVWVAER